MDKRLCLVGGAVRDIIRRARSRNHPVPVPGTPSDLLDLIEEIGGVDLDFVATGYPFDELTAELLKLGKCDVVGKSFGVIKFVPEGDLEFLGFRFSKGRTYDLALPRIERSTGSHHRDFEVEFDHTLPIEDDLMRRDFTINAMAMGRDGALIDPSGGLKDLDEGILRTVFPRSLEEDPLRVLRAAGFAARFELEIASEVIDSAESVSLADVSPERIRIELEKAVVHSKKPSMFFRYLEKMGRLLHVFSEIGRLEPHLELVYSVLDRSRSEHRMRVLYWFLDRTASELEWYSAGASDWFSEGLNEKLRRVIDSLDDPKRQAAYRKSAALVLFERLRFPKSEIARFALLSRHSFRFPETALPLLAGEKRRIIRNTLKILYGDGVDSADFLAFMAVLFPGIAPDWEAETAEVSRFLENPPITGGRLLEMGFEQGVIIGEILVAVSAEHDLGRVSTPEEAEEFVKENYDSDVKNG